MAYVKAFQEGWDINQLKFNIVGDVYGGLWALHNDQAQGFLWEKYTTFPFTEQKKCRYIDEVVTPWPCFVIAVRKDVFNSDKELLTKISDIVNKKAFELKNNSQAAEIISWRYNLRLSQVRNWLIETNWNYQNEASIESFQSVIDYLVKLELITHAEAENWEQKLF
jgi:hypothetical protein